MECPICFYSYDESERKPLRAFCRCHQTLCETCLNQLLLHSTYCPWDRTRWSGRNIHAKFAESTPQNYLEFLQRKYECEKLENQLKQSCLQQSNQQTPNDNDTENTEKDQQVKTPSLSDEEYAKLLDQEEKERELKLCEQEKSDEIFARALLTDKTLRMLYRGDLLSTNIQPKNNNGSKQTKKELNKYPSILQHFSQVDKISHALMSASTNSSSNSSHCLHNNVDVEVIDVEETISPIMGTNHIDNSVNKKHKLEPIPSSFLGPSSSSSSKKQKSVTPWKCIFCTFENRKYAVVCEMCAHSNTSSTIAIPTTTPATPTASNKSSSAATVTTGPVEID